MNRRNRYMVERSFPNGLGIQSNAEGAEASQGVVMRIADEGCTWIHSYVTPDKRKTFCIYDAPSEDAIRRAAARTEIPVDRVTEVRVLDPYFHH